MEKDVSEERENAFPPPPRPAPGVGARTMRLSTLFT